MHKAAIAGLIIEGHDYERGIIAYWLEQDLAIPGFRHL